MVMRNITILFSLLLCIVSCSVHEAGDRGELFYGKRDSVSFSVSYALLPESTKAAEVNETLVEDVNLYLFNELGDLVYYSYSEGSSKVETSVYENMNYSLYALANAHERIYARRVEELQALSYSIADYQEMVSADGSVLMSGSLDAVRLSGRTEVTVNLTRCVAKIVLKCDFSGLNPDVEIITDEVSLRNLPLSVRPFAQSKAAEHEDVSSSTIVEAPSAEAIQQGIVFYQYENMQGLLQEGNLDQTKKWWPDESPYSEICSYVEIKGHYSSSRKVGAITYRFYLGKDMVADYSVERNRQYTVVLCFNGDGAVEENTWRVDNTEIVDLVTSVEISPESHKFTELGASLQLSATVQPLTAANKTLQWSSSDEKVATVDQSGKVTAAGDGACTITAASTDGTNISAECAITVDSKIYVTGIAVEPMTLSLFTGETGELKATIEPADATVPDVLWSSSNEKVATVDQSGKVTAVAPGEAVITAASKDDSSKKATCTVTVQAKDFSIDPTSKTLYVGESFTIGYKVKPPVSPVFESQSPGIATVDQSGKVTAVAGGEAKIKVSAHGIDLYCTVTVVNPQIGFPSSGRVMYNGETVTIPYSVLVPSDADVKIRLSNSNAQIVSSTPAGVTVKAVTPGSCRMTASIGPVSATYDLDIQQLRIVPKESSFTLFNHYDYRIGYDIYPEHASSLGATVTLNGNASQYVSFPDADRIKIRVSMNDASLPGNTQQFSLTLAVNGRSDASATVNFNIDKVSINQDIKLPVNLKYGMWHSVDLGLRAPAKAREQFVISYDPPISQTGHDWVGNIPDLDCDFNFMEGGGNISAYSSSSNGVFTLRLAGIGDDLVPVVLTTTVTIYEALYMVGMAQSFQPSEDIAQPGVWDFLCYVYGRWYTSPESPFIAGNPNLRTFLGKEVTTTIPYRYNNRQYTMASTGIQYDVNGVQYSPGDYLLSAESGERQQFGCMGHELNLYEGIAMQPASNSETGRYYHTAVSGIQMYVYTVFVTNFGTEPYYSTSGVFPWESVYYRAFRILD